MTFQSTLPVWGGTALVRAISPTLEKFQSTLPVWGGTRDALQVFRQGADFNPPSPCGEGHNADLFLSRTHPFQSTLPVWGGTCSGLWRRESRQAFQSTLPVWGGTLPARCITIAKWHFNPPSPCGEGPTGITTTSYYKFISIHPPRVGRDAP